MKLLLTSAGLTTPDIIKEYDKLIGKKHSDIHIVTIEDAANASEGDKSWFTAEKQLLAENCAELTPLPLQSQPFSEIRKMIDSADAIYCFGGDTSYLVKLFQDTGLAKALPEILESKVWIGSSAGSSALCYAETPDFSEKVYGEKRTVDKYLELVPLVLLPHYKGNYKFDELDVSAEGRKTKFPVLALTDESAAVITSKKLRDGSISVRINSVGGEFNVSLGSEVNDAMKSASGPVKKAMRKVADILQKAIDHLEESEKKDGKKDKKNKEDKE